MEVLMVQKSMLLTVLVLIAVISGCTVNRQYVEVRRNFAVQKIFRAGEILPGYRYYYSGQDVEPLALLALDRRYELKSRFWHEFNSAEQLQQWMKEFRRSSGSFDDIEYVTVDYKGLEILSEDKQQIGVIYTRYDWIVAWYGEGAEIYVSRPEPAGHQRSPRLFRRFYD
jgi:hypothetical protein